MSKISSAGPWAAGDAYEPYIGRWSLLVAREFLSWLSIGPGGRWIDVGCGTGALTRTILATTSPTEIDAVDSSAEYVNFARDRVTDVRVRFAVADARHLPPALHDVDVTVSGLMLNFVREPELAVREMTRVTRPGGTVAVYVWDYAGDMQLIRHFWDAAVALDPKARELDEGHRFPVCNPVALEKLFLDAGLHEVETRPIDVRTRFTDFNDYWTPFLGGQGPAPGYAMRLDDDSRSALRERIRARLPIAADGSIDLVARAWAVRGTRARNDA